MRIIKQETIPNNTGRAYVVKKGQRIRVSGTTIVDFVAFNHANLRDRFDQDRTKASQDKLFLSKGDFLASKANRPMLRIVEDTYTEGTHDLEKGMCSTSSYQIRAKLGKLDQYQERPIGEVPDHGCWENLTEALKPWEIAPEDIPNPFNIFMTMEIDGKTGKLAHTAIRPSKPAHVELEAEIDCLIGISACPDTTVGGKPVDIIVYEN
jgi:uncharacterized protein YcgI (DUF1989 family)